MSRASSARLSDLLEVERQALLGGDFAALADIAARKEPLMQALAADRPGAEMLDRIGAKLRRNHRLLEAAMGGLRAATDRMKAIEDVQAALSTYDQSGQKADLARPIPAIERKA